MFLLTPELFSFSLVHFLFLLVLLEQLRLVTLVYFVQPCELFSLLSEHFNMGI